LTEQEGVLVARAIEGDADAYGELYLRHIDAIYRYVYFKVGDVAQAEDLTEEVFVKAWEALPKYRVGKSPFTSWLYRIAHNLTVDFFRRDQAAELLTESTSNHFRESESSPEQIAADNQAIQALVEAVMRLDPEEQQVLLLRFVEGLSHKQVAETIGKSDGASRVIQHRALAAMAELLGENRDSDDE
jgi:RNA polymerase sigma-70 factor (ECF subfamily)